MGTSSDLSGPRCLKNHLLAISVQVVAQNDQCHESVFRVAGFVRTTPVTHLSHESEEA